MSEYNYVVMMYDKDSEKHGQPLRIDTIRKSKFSKEKIQEKIKEWADKKAAPVLIEGPFMITVFDMLYNRDELKAEKTEAGELKSEIRSIIASLEDLL